MLVEFEVEFYDEDFGMTTTKGLTFGNDLADIGRRLTNYYGESIIKLTLVPIEDVIDLMEVPSLEPALKDMGL